MSLSKAPLRNSTVYWDNDNRTVGVNRDTFSDASHKKAIQAVPTVRSKGDEVRLPSLGGVEDDGPGISRRVRVLGETVKPDCVSIFRAPSEPATARARAAVTSSSRRLAG